MDGLARGIGAPVGIKWQGKTWMAEPLRLWALASCEQFCLIAREHPIDRASNALNALAGRESLQRYLYDMAYADMRKDRTTRMVPLAELEAWMSTAAGIAYSAWCMLHRVHPQCINLEDVEAQVEGTETHELRAFCRARDMAAGMDVLASLDWRGRVEEEKLIPADRLKRRREEAAARGPKFIPWRRILRYFASQYGWGPDTVGQLTFWHVKLYTAEEGELGGIASMSPAEAAGYQMQRAMMNG